MFCPNCGNEVGEGKSFCGQCGARLGAAVPEAIVPEPVVEEIAAPEAVVPPVEEPAAQLQMPIAEASNDEKPEEPVKKPKKKKKKLWLILTAVLLVLVLAVTAFFVFPTVQNTFWQLVLSEEDYFKHVVKNNFKGINKDLAASMETLKGDRTVTGTMEVEISPYTKQMIRDMGGEEAANALGWLNSVSMDATSTVVDGKSSVKADLKMNNKHITNMDMVVIKDAMYVNIPELNGKALRVEEDSSSAFMMYNFANSLPSEKATEKLLNKYVAKAVDSIENVTEEKEEVQVGDLSQKYTKLTVKLDEKAFRKIAIDTLEEFKDDKEIKSIYINLAKKNGSSNPEEDYDRVIEEVKDIIRSLKDAESDSSETVKLCLWVDAAGKITGASLLADDVQIGYNSVIKGTKVAMKAAVKADGQEFALSGNGEVAGGKFAGTYKLAFKEKEFVTIEISNLDIKTYADGMFNGTVKISASESGMEMLKMLSGEEAFGVLSKIELVFNFTSASKTENTAELIVNYSGNQLGVLRSKATVAEGGEVALPSSYTGDADAWANDMVQNVGNLANALEQAGMPAQYAGNLRQQADWTIAGQTGDYDAYYMKYYGMTQMEFIEAAIRIDPMAAYYPPSHFGPGYVPKAPEEAPVVAGELGGGI